MSACPAEETMRRPRRQDAALAHWRRAHKIVLEANPHFRETTLEGPGEGTPEDAALLAEVARHEERHPADVRCEVHEPRAFGNADQ